jgi:hypothetical protein
MQGNQRQALRLAYCAGIIDGEGSICVTKTKPQQARTNPLHAPMIRVGMVEREVLEFMQETFESGYLYDEGVRKDRPTNQFIYRWRVTNRDEVIRIINMILPYLIVKRRQALLVKEMCQGWVLSPSKKLGTPPEELLRREDYYNKCKILNAVGAAATTKPRDTCEGEAIV